MTFKDIAARAMVASIVIPFLLCVVMAGSIGTAQACAAMDPDSDHSDYSEGDIDKAPQSLCAEPEPELPFFPFNLLGISLFATVEIGIIGAGVAAVSGILIFFAFRKKRRFIYYYP